MGNADDETPTPAPPTVQASIASREMMRALADKLSINLRMHVGLMEAAVGEMIEGLYAGRFEVYLDAHTKVRSAAKGIHDALANVRKTHEAIDQLDPAYGEAVGVVSEEIIRRDVARDIRKIDVVDLATRWAGHMIACTAPDRCGESKAYAEEFKRRNMPLPNIAGITGSKR